MNPHIKIIGILVFSLLFTIIFSFLIQKGEKKYRIHNYKRINEIFKAKSYYDILYLGSSRVHTTINPHTVDSITGLTSYNIGVEGGNMYEFKVTLDGYLKNHPPPKMMAIGVDARSFDVKNKLFYPPQYFYNLNNTVLKNTFKEDKNYKTFFLEYLPFLNVIYYDDYVKSTALKGLMGKNQMKLLNAFEYNGFLSNGYNCIDTAINVNYKPTPTNIQQDGIDCLKGIIDTCRKRNIQLILIYAPEYKFKLQKSISNFNAFVSTVDLIVKEYGLQFFRDDSLSICNVPCFFANYGHVNTQGSFEYSKILAARIKELFVARQKI